MEDKNINVVTSPDSNSHSRCLTNLLLLLGEDHKMDRLSELLHYTAIAEREYAALCRLRHM